MSWDFPDSLQHPAAAQNTMAQIFNNFLHGTIIQTIIVPCFLLKDLCNYEYTVYQI